MNFDASLSLEVILAILAIVGAVWRLETRIAASHTELKGDIRRLDAKIDDVGQRLDAKIDDVGQRLDAKIDDVGQRLDAKIDDVGQRLDAKIDGVRDRVDDGNQRLARLEGRFEGREERLASEGETNPAT